jgi:hypothetical protein
VHALTELEADAVLAEEVIGDAIKAWTNFLVEPITPRSLQRLIQVLVRLTALHDQINKFRIEVRDVVLAAKKELG